MPEKPSETQSHDSSDTLPSRDEAERPPEITWNDVVDIFNNKSQILVRDQSGNWCIGRVERIYESAKQLTVAWGNPEKSANISFNTFKEWHEISSHPSFMDGTD
jgi:hypothetical protein